VSKFCSTRSVKGWLRGYDQLDKGEMSGIGDDFPQEGGHMSSMFGRIVRTSDPRRPYTAILTHDQCAETQSSFATMREAEDFIRRNTPRPRPRSTFWDREAPED